jgi:hypothetical protein
MTDGDDIPFDDEDVEVSDGPEIEQDDEDETKEDDGSEGGLVDDQNEQFINGKHVTLEELFYTEVPQPDDEDSGE